MVKNVRVQATDGATALHWAVEVGDTEVVRILLEHGAYVDAQTTEGQTALHEAARAGDTEVVRILLEHRANIHAQTEQSNQTI